MKELIVDVFRKTDRLWKLKNDDFIQPTEEDVQVALDAAAKELYTEPVGARLNLGGLIIEKTASDHVVYAYVGRYK